MRVTTTDFPDLYLIEPRVFEDPRGFFFESYNRDAFEKQGIRYDFCQDNHSRSTYGVLRGLHFQRPPYAQTKLVRVTRGKVLDVAVDIRRGSPTFMKAYTIELSETNKLQLLIPKGFAHGFVVLSDVAEFLYKCDEFYNKESEGGILYNDSKLAIDWGIGAQDVILSEKDAQNPTLEEAVFDFPFESFTNTK